MPKLSIGNLIDVPVKLFIRNGGKVENHAFTLVCERLDADTLDARVKAAEKTTIDVLREVARDWKGQRIVVEDDNTPAAFSADNLDVLLQLPNAGNIAYSAYLAEVVAKEKNS